MGQPACLEKDLFINLIKSSTKMAPRDSRSCRSPHRNLFPIDLLENELVRDPGPIGGLHLGSTSPAPSCNPTLVPALVPTLIPAPALALM